MFSSDLYIYISYEGIIKFYIKFLQLCFQGSRDNMSIVIITLENAPKPNEHMIMAELTLNQKLEEKVKGKGYVE